MLHHLQGCIFLQFRNTFSLSKTFEVGNRKYKIIFDRPCFEKRFLQWIWHFEKDYILGTFKVHSVIISKMQCKKTNGNSAVWIDKIFASNFKKCFIFSNPSERKGNGHYWCLKSSTNLSWWSIQNYVQSRLINFVKQKLYPIAYSTYKTKLNYFLLAQHGFKSCFFFSLSTVIPLNS